MKILAIRGKNLASLEGEFEIDFTTEPLKSAGVFVITGITGSGKSTLLDALCLALFDDTPRTSRAGENIQIVDVKDKTINQKDSRTILRRGCTEGYAEVDFISLGGEKFCSTWLVKRARSKADGALQNSEIRLWNLSLNVELQGRKTELLQKITELIGLTFDQFTRAVLLAQGDFATFLKARQSEKAELLEKLTGTDIYSRISTAIYEKSRNAEQDLSVVRERVRDIELLPETDREQLLKEQEQVKETLVLLKGETMVLTDKLKWIAEEEVLQREYTQAGQLSEDSRAAIEIAGPRFRFMEKLECVREIRDTFNELRISEKQLNNDRAELGRLRTGQDGGSRKLSELEESCRTIEKEKEELEKEYKILEPQLNRARELDIKIADSRAGFEEARKEAGSMEMGAERLFKNIEAMELSLERAKTEDGQLSAWFKAHEEYRGIVSRAELIVNLLDDAATARKQGEDGKRMLESCLESCGELESGLIEIKGEAERLNKLQPAEIGVLRSKLSDDYPCPVCGSLHHPYKDQKAAEVLREEELNLRKKAISEEAISLSEKIEKKKNETVRLTTSVESYTTIFNTSLERAGIYLGVLPLWKERYERGGLQRELTETAVFWSEKTAEAERLKEKIRELENKIRSERDRLAEVNEGVKTKKLKLSEAEALNERFQLERKRLLTGMPVDDTIRMFTGKRETVALKLKKVTDDKNSCVRILEGVNATIARIAGEIRRLEENRILLNNAIDKWTENRRAVLSPEQLPELLAKENSWQVEEKRYLDGLKQKVTVAQATLAERQGKIAAHHILASKPGEKEEKPFLQSLLAEKNTLLDSNMKRDAEIGMILAAHEKGKERVKAFEKELTEKEILSENWKKLNDVFGSASGNKFKEIAQGYTLELLLAYANKHLRELSGRYELQRIPDTLALQVSDLDMMGEVRAVHSLSGGESFLISLALALGLSSLSSNRMKVESLFIDEGFGSLDLDTLRVALDALESLQTQGRKIGVISHVSEITERISVQVRVVRSANGRSRVEIAGT